MFWKSPSAISETFIYYLLSALMKVGCWWHAGVHWLAIWEASLFSGWKKRACSCRLEHNNIVDYNMVICCRERVWQIVYVNYIGLLMHFIFWIFALLFRLIKADTYIHRKIIYLKIPREISKSTMCKNFIPYAWALITAFPLLSYSV